MSEFCKKCSIKIFGEDFGDLANLCKKGEIAYVICEGCGYIVVDHEGERITTMINEIEDRMAGEL